MPTRTVFIEVQGPEGAAVVFYLDKKDNRLMGILLWNLPEDLFVDEEFAAPSRLHLARQILAYRLTINEDEQLLGLAQKFDLAQEIAESYAELKTIGEAAKQQEQQQQLEEEQGGEKSQQQGEKAENKKKDDPSPPKQQPASPPQTATM